MDDHAPVDLVFPGELWDRLHRHLFRGDSDEHGAVLASGFASSSDSARLLVRNVFLAEDGVDYVPGQHGYRMLTADFVRDRALYCRDEHLAYLAVHNHFGRDQVEFSFDDFRSHERGYPALRDIVGGPIVGGVVFAENAVAGDLWLADRRVPLRSAVVVEPNIARMFPSARRRHTPSAAMYDRQARVFGDRGQELLGQLRVGIIGLGGVGSMVNEQLARLGVGSLVLVDPETLEDTNVPRVTGSALADVDVAKVELAARTARVANPSIEVVTLGRTIVDDDVARSLASCDALLLAADTMQARLVFNAVVHQYLIPGFQIGSKITVDRATGEVGDVFSVVRPIMPSHGCLLCNGLISGDRLAEEALTESERRAQRYVDEDDVKAPSVITLNGVGASRACNELLMRAIGLREAEHAGDFVYIDARSGNVRYEEPRKDPDCRECGSSTSSRFARGDSVRLPTRSVP